MGWFWDDKPSGADPRDKLDPALRKFLEKESPLKYDDLKPKAGPSASSSSPHDASPTYRTQIGLEASATPTPSQPRGDRPTVPPESLFQDGRYAHLWKTYRPLSEVEAGGRSDADRLTEVVEAYNDRKAEIGRAAVQNCVEYQIAEKDCFRNGSLAQMMSMCREENKAFNRCYTMQSRFLRALGYLSMHRSPEEEERIQMHADKLYHEMLEREALAKKAKEEGLEAPVLPPLIQAERTVKALGEDSAWARARQKARETGVAYNLSAFAPEKQEEIKKRLAKLEPVERELELQLLAAETRAQLEYADKIQERMVEEKRAREERREAGQATFGDSVKRLWGWDK